jgi:hypothetical protein
MEIWLVRPPGLGGNNGYGGELHVPAFPWLTNVMQAKKLPRSCPTFGSSQHFLNDTGGRLGIISISKIVNWSTGERVQGGSDLRVKPFVLAEEKAASQPRNSVFLPNLFQVWFPCHTPFEEKTAHWSDREGAARLKRSLVEIKKGELPSSRAMR